VTDMMQDEDVMDPFSLEAVLDEPTPRALRMVFYGSHGAGKTTLGSRFPNALLQRTEDGLRNIRVRHFPAVAQSYGDIAKGINAVLRRPADVGTFVHDSLDWTEPLVWAETCERNNIPSIESPGYGKGYLEADKVWAELFQGFDAIRDAGVHVVLIAHAEVTKYTPPDSDAYDRYDLALHKRARAMVHEWADVVGFVHEKTYTRTIEEGAGKSKRIITKGAGSGGRFLYLERKATHEAKNGYGLPAEVPLDENTAPELLVAIENSFAF
jgi:hypothetical protein